MLVQAAECNVHSNVKCTRIYVSCASIVPGQQIHNNESQEAFEDSGYLVRSMTSQSCCRSYPYPYTLVCLFCQFRRVKLISALSSVCMKVNTNALLCVCVCVCV